MPEHSNDLEARVTSLEQQMAGVSAEAKAAFELARHADRDVSVIRDKLNAHTQVLNALRETQLEHGQILREHDARFDRLEARFDGLEARFNGLEREMRNGFSTVAVGMSQITALLTGIAGSAQE